ncbi:MAG TPA: zinc ribbon domain-containing protein [Acidobacteriaceae bacterium]|nr:zinc ribbon domain-containing protein [Terriglobia bacterium]HVC91987.1 zinc ribbon domain-containing protein [Acidobacteriaceae bacterium]
MARGDSSSSFSVSEELKLIPRWSIVLAFVAFIGIQYLFFFVMPQPHHQHAPLPVHIYFGTSWGALVAGYVLMIGYISEDAPRRNMGKWLWILLCIILQGGIGPVIYFLLRQPILSQCPCCGTRVDSNFNYCPQCAYRVAPNCGVCHESVRITDLYCTNCGHDLSEDNTPARLRAYGV